MKRLYVIAIVAIVGSIAGGLGASLIAIPSARFEPGLIIPALKFFAPSGLIIGLICGAIVGVFNNKVVGVSIGGTLFLICFCIGSAISLFWYAQTPWPSPRPYPGTETIAAEGPAGTWGWSRSYSYTVDLPLNHAQQYYEEEMLRFCGNDWQFETLIEDMGYSRSNWWGFEALPDYVANSTCREAQCQIPRDSLAQEFRVLLCADGEKQTIVIQVDGWED